MTEPNDSCPNSERLRGLLDETLPADEQALLQAHIDHCADCQKALEKLVAGSVSWESAVEHLRDAAIEQSGEDPLLAEAVERIKMNEPSDSFSATASTVRITDYLTPSDQPNSLGRLGTYEVTEIVGQGGMGVVMKSFDPVLHRVVAVKVLAPYLANNPQARKRFIREAQAIAAVSHDHVITIHGIDESVEQPKIIMQFIAGRSLQERLDAQGSLDVKEILRIGMQTAAGLAAAHAQGLVHRDVKPSNILLENGVQRVKLTDFGLARAVDDASLTQSGVIAGTPQYMAPEQANGDAVDARADLFSLGSVMYAMCVGHSPFRASTTMGVLKRVCHDSPRPIQEMNPDIPAWLCGIIMKLLEKDPADRFQTARSVADLLEKWLAHLQQPAMSPRPPIVERPPEPSVAARTQNGSRSNAEINARTILFQPVSGRWLLFFMLAGMAGLMAFGMSTGTGILEMLLIAFSGGLLIAFWGLLLVALVKFIGANLSKVVRWFRGESALETKETAASDAITSRYPFLPPESLAMLAAIITLVLGGSPIEAVIIAVPVWWWASGRFAGLKRFAPAQFFKSSKATVPSSVGSAGQIAAEGDSGRQ